MCWISSPKVRLALIVNGLYFVSLLTPTTPHTRPRFFARLGEHRDARVSTKMPPSYAPLAPPLTAPSKADVNYFKEFDQLDVFLTNDLTLVRKPGHLLQLSPILTTRMSVAEQPRSILLRFVAFSDVQSYSEKTPLMISTDGMYKWDDSQEAARGPRTNSVRYFNTADAGGRMIETVGIDLPYETFLEIISGRQIVIELGGDTVELNADQIEALRDMHRRLPTQIDYMRTPTTDKTGRPSTVTIEPNIYSRPLNPKPPAKRQ